MQKPVKGSSEQADADKGRRRAPAGSRTTLSYGPLEDQLGYLLRRAQIAVFRDFFEAFNEFNVRPAQYSVLTVIESNPGLSQSQVCEALGIRKTNFVPMLDALEARDLVRRASSPSDRRSYALFLTDNGQDFVRKLHRAAAKHERRIVDKIGVATHRRIFEILGSIASMSEENYKTP